MPKCHAPHAVSYRGKALAIAPDGSCDLDDVQLAELSAHGVRTWNGAVPETPIARREHPAVAADNPPPPEIVALDPATALREELIQALKGKVRENIRFMKTDALRALAAKVLPNVPAIASVATTAKKKRKSPHGPR